MRGLPDLLAQIVQLLLQLRQALHLDLQLAIDVLDLAFHDLEDFQRRGDDAPIGSAGPFGPRGPGGPAGPAGPVRPRGIDAWTRVAWPDVTPGLRLSFVP